MSASDALNGVQFKHRAAMDDEGRSYHLVSAHHEGQEVGQLHWLSSASPHEAPEGEQPGQITNLVVNPPYRRKGLATSMWHHAHVAVPTDPPKHSDRKTPSGAAWAARVGG